MRDEARSPDTSGEDRRRSPLRAVSAAALLLALLVTVAGVLTTRAVVHDQEHRLLKERTAEVGLVLTSAINNIPATLDSQGSILRETNGSNAAYTRAAAASVAAGPGQITFAWLRPQSTGAGYVVLAAAGSGLHAGEVITDARVRTFAAASQSKQFVATPVFGADRRLGFAVGAPAAPAGTVLYRESVLGPVSPPRQAASAPFNEIDVVLYATPTVQPAQALTSTGRTFPLRGDVINQPLAAGDSHWLLSVKARHALVGSVATVAPWVVLAGGVLGALLIAAVIETAARRRDSALALYASEHWVAETLQRSLLPTIPAIPGLELAAQYVAAGSGQEVGGDWFDAFPVAGGKVGLAVGDVIGHDLAAASAMAEIRAALRAYAIDGDSPSTVINRLDHLVAALDLTQLVTVIYATLDPAAADGSRLLRYANAGHHPPLLRAANGRVRSVTGGDSVVIGAPILLEHTQAEERLEAGATLLLFTDGLVEVPGQPLEDSLARLAATIAGSDPADGVEALCERVLATTSGRTLRDDVALLAVRIMGPQRLGGGQIEAEPAHAARNV